MSKMCDDCLMIHCSYEPFSEACQSTRDFSMEEYTDAEVLNNENISYCPDACGISCDECFHE